MLSGGTRAARRLDSFNSPRPLIHNGPRFDFKYQDLASNSSLATGNARDDPLTQRAITWRAQLQLPGRLTPGSLAQNPTSVSPGRCKYQDQLGSFGKNTIYNLKLYHGFLLLNARARMARSRRITARDS